MSVELGRQKSIYNLFWGNFLGTEKTIYCGGMRQEKLAYDEIQYHKCYVTVHRNRLK
jgi:hypothetical protein